MKTFCIYIKDENDKYTIKILENGIVKEFAFKEDAIEYAESKGLKQYVVKYSDWDFNK